METEIQTQTKRKCGKCKKEKILSTDNFHKEIRGKDGFNSTCKECKNEYRNKPEIKEKAKARSKEYHNSEEFKEKRKQYRSQDYVQEKRRIYERTEEVKEKKKEYNNIPEVKEKERIRLRKLYKEKYENNPDFRVSETIRSRILKELKTNKTSNTSEYLGCSVSFLKKWLEYRFEPEMTWDNFGTYWQIDHILPISGFDFSNERNKFICFNWTNLQPLTSKENNFKKDKLMPHYYFNNIVNITRFNAKYKEFQGYQVLNESLVWLREKLGYGKNANVL